MATDPRQIDLTDEQKQRIAEKAEQLGVDCSALLDELLGMPRADTEGANGDRPRNMLDAMRAIGAVGCFEGPGDLSTNSKYMG